MSFLLSIVGLAFFGACSDDKEDEPDYRFCYHYENMIASEDLPLEYAASPEYMRNAIVFVHVPAEGGKYVFTLSADAALTNWLSTELLSKPVAKYNFFLKAAYIFHYNELVTEENRLFDPIVESLIEPIEYIVIDREYHLYRNESILVRNEYFTFNTDVNGFTVTIPENTTGVSRQFTFAFNKGCAEGIDPITHLRSLFYLEIIQE